MKTSVYYVTLRERTLWAYSSTHKNAITMSGLFFMTVKIELERGGDK